MSVNGRQRKLTNKSAYARLTMKRLVGDRIMVLFFTTITTEILPSNPKKNISA